MWAYQGEQDKTRLCEVYSLEEEEGLVKTFHKILFGSDHPYNPLSMEVEKISRHVTRAAKLNPDDLKKVFSTNFLSLLKWEHKV